MIRIPLARPYIGDEEVRAVSRVIRSGKLSLGPKLPEFEKRFARYIGVEYAVAVNSGTSGLHLCMKALDIKPGDEIITTPFSFVASSNPAIFERAKPVFVDIDEKTCNIDPGKIERALSRRTKAIVLVHVFGRPCEMGPIMKIARKYNLAVIEDACEALGATYGKKKAGSFGKAGVFAFYPNKQITTGEGGMIVTNDKKTAEICRSLRNQGRNDSGEWLNHVRIGYNYRLDEMSCALGLEQLKKIDFIIRRRREIACEYTSKLKNVGGLIVPAASPQATISWWVYYLRVADAGKRNRILEYLNDRGVSSRGYFDPPIHLQPVYKKMFGYKKGAFPEAEKVAASGFIIPFFVGLKDKEVNRVCDTVKQAIRRISP